VDSRASVVADVVRFRCYAILVVAIAEQSKLLRTVRKNSFFLRKIDGEHFDIQNSRLSDNLVLGLLIHGVLGILVTVSTIRICC
jgi:hypothetical protein